MAVEDNYRLVSIGFRHRHHQPHTLNGTGSLRLVGRGYGQGGAWGRRSHAPDLNNRLTSPCLSSTLTAPGVCGKEGPMRVRSEGPGRFVDELRERL